MAQLRRNKTTGGTNPFSNSFDDDDNTPHSGGGTDDAGGTKPGAGGGAAAAAAASGSSNPFDFDVDFSQVQKRRERARAARESQKEEAEQPILPGMDADDPPAAVKPLIAGTTTTTTNEDGTGGATSNNKKRPNIVQRSKTTPDLPPGSTGAGLLSGQNRKQNFRFGINTIKKAATDLNKQNMGASDTLYEEEEEYFRESIIQVGKRKLAVWPYDDYHLVQKLYYQKLEELSVAEESQKAAAESRNSSPTHKYNPNKSRDLVSSPNNANGNNNNNNTSIPIFQRPADPPDIPTAVQGLPLTDFEYKAEERAIAIVSTWLFDAGLIDELLVNGGMTGLALSLGGGKGSGIGGASGTSGDDRSVHTSEGIEVGQFGFPIEGATKMDKEIAKLRNSTKRQLALINARLNDGVAATGSEVQELVNAVIATKDDIGRLRELSTYVSNQETIEQSSQFMLTKYPKLKQAINARKNLARCFRELDFFSQIPSQCDRLREELHSGEWTAHEWSTLRSVCREHVELEIFLVEAEAGMKKRLDEDEEDQEKQQQQKANSRGRRNTKGAAAAGSKFSRNAFAASGLTNDDALIDKFLSEHVDNVWELGDEIRMRIMSGIGNAFELAMNNPAGMVALVEAVEVYEQANHEYKSVHGVEAGRSQNLRFTDMRAAALGELYKDLENRGLEVFKELTQQAAENAQSEDEVASAKFSAVLRACNELTSEIGLVKEQMAPCFPKSWAIETLWTTCAAHVCSNHILQEIGGPEGHKLPDLNVNQLLDLVAWVETFREIIEETFPNIGAISSKRTYFDQPPKLLVDNNKSVDIEVARDSLAWVNNTLWDVHDLAKDEFLFRTKEQTEVWLDNVYRADHNKSQTAEGRLVTSLCEDVYAVAGVQLRTIRERLTRRSEALVQAVGVIFKNLYEKQMSSREMFCTDLETCCAASNDFIRMSEKCEEVVNEIKDECDLSHEAADTLEEQAAALLGLYSGDAVYAAQKTHIYCFEPIEEAIGNELFRVDWLDNMTHNELSLTLVRTLDDFMGDLETFLDEVMVQKTVEAQVVSSVNFYIRILLARASEHNSGRNSFFSSNEKALARIKGDISTMREYFDGLTEGMPTLTRIIEAEFSFLEAVVEILSIASGLSDSDAHDFILVIQKRVRNVEITKYVVGDLYHLVNPGEERTIYELIDGMEEKMVAVAPTDERAVSLAQDRMTVPGLRIDQIMAKHCDESQRKRPLQKGTIDRAEAAFRAWRGLTGKKPAKGKSTDDEGEADDE